MTRYTLQNPAETPALLPLLPEAAAKIAALYPNKPLAYLHSFGCQQNVSDGERLCGVLSLLGYGFTDEPEKADLILYNTCAVRKSAEDRLFGQLGELKRFKAAKPSLVLIVCGCIFQQEGAAQRVRRHYPYIDLVYGTGLLGELPRLLYRHFTEGVRIFERRDTTPILESLPVVRQGGCKAWLPIMQGCDNFCAYCIVPYVRGREASRRPEAVLAEAGEILAQGAREITLLGQNVNSYGKGLELKTDFPALLSSLAQLPGDFWLRFMTSHPKDCTPRLLDVMASSPRIARHLHLPVQSGSNRVLAAMNRRYSAEHYLGIVEYARRRMPDLTLSSDIIVGFPGETRADFEATLSLVKRVRFSNLFTFIYSPREGTPAASLPDPVPAEEKREWMAELLAVQEAIGAELSQAMPGQVVRVLAEGEGKEPATLTGRTEHNTIVQFTGEPRLIGNFVPVKIQRAQCWALFGEALGDTKGTPE